MLLTADFETTTDKEDCRVWAWGLCNIQDPDWFRFGNSIESLMDFCAEGENHTLYFHNLKFDGEFIFVWLFEHGFMHVKSKQELITKTFTTLISDAGQFYIIQIMFSRNGSKSIK
jgi:hypothetical protein